MNLKLSFSWIGLAVFALPMLINIAYVIFPPVEKPSENGADHAASRSGSAFRLLEIIEKTSRVAYLLAIAFLVSKNPLEPFGIMGLLTVVFLMLYYAVWIRYFIHGRNVSLLGKSFLFVPMPLAVFPVLYFLCAAIVMQNLPAAVVMLIFGAAHITISVQSFR